MDIDLKKELHEVAVNFIFNVCESARLEDGRIFPAIMHAFETNASRYTMDELHCCDTVMAQMVAIRDAAPGSDLDHHRFKSTMHDVENFTFTKGVNIITGIFQDVLGDGFLGDVMPDFAMEAEVRAAMREVGATNLADVCDHLALTP